MRNGSIDTFHFFRRQPPINQHKTSIPIIPILFKFKFW